MLEEGEFKRKKEFTEEEQEFWKECYKVGMKNNWMNGEFDRLDGNFIVEDDRLNENSVVVIETIENLRKLFVNGNHCLGSSVIYKNLCFMNQVNGGSEFLVIRNGKNGVLNFESWSAKLMVERGELTELIERVLKATDDQLRNLEY